VVIVSTALSVFAWGDDHKVKRVFDNPPKEPVVLKSTIPAEYNDLVKVFDEYWGALIKKDFKTAYNLESADFRKTTGFDQYKGRFGNKVVLKNVKALGLKKINEKEVIVKGSIMLEANLEGIRDMWKPLNNDRWVKEGEEWRHVQASEKTEKSVKTEMSLKTEKDVQHTEKK
jgi:hypothetical protein